ncbi:hypothetical protein DFH08DRAFT_243210 [Mycena albidolilacea]|uniref:Secreted protein n=1 Tax=Mycena albidolilacea TaxID=1033008 RepID=A0AAD7EMK4_9AGAR|nr:hypothetical protein DFH08DRAFT_243210 [Mycena albidolilacea]
MAFCHLSACGLWIACRYVLGSVSTATLATSSLGTRWRQASGFAGDWLVGFRSSLQLALYCALPLEPIWVSWDCWLGHIVAGGCLKYDVSRSKDFARVCSMIAPCTRILGESHKPQAVPNSCKFVTFGLTPQKAS